MSRPEPTEREWLEGLRPEDEWDYYHEDGGSCSWCGDEGVQECDDPIQCTRRHFGDMLENCSACRGSGLAKDQVIW